MIRIGYHASHEQFAPDTLLALVALAERAGFACAKCSDHFHPWSTAQGQSGHAWTWLGAALQQTRLPFGVVSAPGYRYHPAILAQAAATAGQMFPGRFWMALGSGEAINEAITGRYWPEKPERNATLVECLAVIRALFNGETVTHRGRIDVVEATLFTRPPEPVPLYGAAVSAETARLLAPHVDGLLTTGGDPDSVAPVIAAFRDGGGEGKPVVLQSAVCWAESYDAALAGAVEQWTCCAVGGEIAWDLRRPADFDRLGAAVSEREVTRSVFVSNSFAAHTERLAQLAGLGVEAVHLHQVGTNQRAFIEAFGTHVLPAFAGHAERAAL